MSLYSSDILSNVDKDNPDTAPVGGVEKSHCDKKKEEYPWCYLFVHHTKVDVVNEKLKEQYNTFIHKSVSHKRKKKGIKKLEHQTIAGLIFVQGRSNKVQAFLSAFYPKLFLAKDCSTGEAAIISNKIMQSFMQLSRVDSCRIRFLPHVFHYYSTGNTLIRICSGVLAGFEGYLVRISRDKCLVTTIGNMTVAISGVCKEDFENADEYIQQQKI